MRSKAIFILVALLAFGFAAQASPVSEREARLAARAFAFGGERFGRRYGGTVEKTRLFALTNGASFLSVKMSGGSTIFLSGDSEDEPIVAMSPVDVSEPEVGSPLRTLLEKDMTARMRFRKSQTAASSSAALKARRKWQRLLRDGEAIDMAGEGRVPSSSAAPTDLRVDALVKSKWDQSGNGEDRYTPNHYVCGCVATAMAQIMRYWSYPVAEVPVFSNSGCAVDGVTTNMTAMGGVYDWANMPLDPTGASKVEREAIGRLTYDCGVSVAMDWGSVGSGAFTENVAAALKSIFRYANAECSRDATGLSSDESVREKRIYASLDAGCPVQLGINQRGQNGHSIVADGYGYIDNVSYVHLNMGWAGSGDVWYHLPDITYVATSGGFEYDADTIQTCIYNIFPETTGVVLSGRTMSDEGEVVANAMVSIYRLGETEPVTNMTSSAYGVYAAILPEGEYVATATDGYISGDADFTVANENRWGCDIVMSAPSVRLISSDYAETNICSSLDRALRLAASMDSPLIEVFKPTILKADALVTNSCRIAAGPEIGGGAFVSRRGVSPAALVVSNATVVFEDILFDSASVTPLFAVNGGVVALAGVTSSNETLSVETSGGGLFALAGDIDGGVQVVAENAMTNGAVFGFAPCGLATAAANAAKIINPEDFSLGGEAFVDPDSGEVFLRWAEVPVDPSAAIVFSVDSGNTTNYFRSVDDAMASGATEIVLRRSSTLTKKFQPSNSVVIQSVNGAVLKAGSDSQILVSVPGVTVTFKDVTVGGFNGSDAFIVVDGGKVSLQSGSVLEGLVSCNAKDVYGPVVVKSGTFEMNSGAVIRGCRAESPGNANETGGRGGAVYLYPGAVLDMKGGVISNCYAEVSGGGVYAYNGATVRLSGDATISGNTAGIGPSGTDAEDDLRRSVKANVIIDGSLSGSIGIVGTTVAANEAGFCFAATNGTYAVTAGDINAFYCTAEIAASQTRRAVISENGEVSWVIEDISFDPVPVPPAVAVARTISSATTNYWATLSDAFLSITGNVATVELLDDCAFVDDLVVLGCVKLITAADYSGANPVALVSRAGQCRVSVGAGSSLTVEGVDFSGIDVASLDGGDCRLFDVNGGALRLDGAYVSDVYGMEDRASAAIVAYNGATVELAGGTQVEYCCNYFEGDDVDIDIGAAGGVIAEGEGTVLRLLGCSISRCDSRKTGGVFVGNKAEVHVSGAVTIEDNRCDDINSGGCMMVAKSARLYLDGELTGRVGYVEGMGGDTNVFGVVSSSVPGVAASATNFVHDVTHARGGWMIDADTGATNLVWDLAGRVLVPVPVFPPQEFTYDGTVHVFATNGVGYVVDNGAAVDAGDYVAYAMLDDGCVWDDGTSEAKQFSWSIAKAALSVTANDAEKTEGEEDPPEFSYTVTGLVGEDIASNVIYVALLREPGENPGEYAIALLGYVVKNLNYSFDSANSFTPGVFTINPDEGGLLPDIDPEATLDDILSALDSSGVSDPAVKAAVEAYYAADPDGARAAYNAFRAWAKNKVGDVPAVCSSDKAWVSYEFGADSLFENNPTVVVTSMSIEDPSSASMRVTLVVKDGDSEKTVDPDSVAALFRMSTDLVTWSDDLTATPNGDGSYTVSPNDPTLTSAFITLKY